VENEEEDDEGLGAAAFLITNLVRLFLSLSLFCFVFFLVKGFVSKFPVYSAALERERAVCQEAPFFFFPNGRRRDGKVCSCFSCTVVFLVSRLLGLVVSLMFF